MSIPSTVLVLTRKTDDHSSVAQVQGYGFETLPLALLSPDVVEPPASEVRARFEQYPAAHVALLKGIDWLLTKGIDVLNLTVGPRSGVFDPNDPLQVAARTAHDRGVPVVVSAGNQGPGDGTLRALAQAPWVIAVGAADPNGTLLTTSSRGTPGGTHPAVVSDGSPASFALPPRPEWTDFSPGTSFAAPRVTRAATWILKCLQMLIGDLVDLTGETWSPLSRPVRLPLVGIPDSGFDPEYLPPLPPLVQELLQTGQEHVRVSRSEKERDWLATLISTLRKEGVACEVSSAPHVVLRALQQAARPLPAYAPHQVGAGFLSDHEVEQYLASFTPSRFVTLFAPPIITPSLGIAIRDLDDTLGVLWGPNKVMVLKTLFVGGIRFAVAKVL